MMKAVFNRPWCPSVCEEILFLYKDEIRKGGGVRTKAKKFCEKQGLQMLTPTIYNSYFDNKKTHYLIYACKFKYIPG